MTHERSNLKGVGFGLAAFACFSAHDVIVKILGASYAPVQIVFFSVLLSFPLATLMLMRDKTQATLRPRYPGWIVARTAATVITAISAFYAFSSLPLAQTYAILFASPLLITLLSIPILGEKVRIRRGLAVVVGLAGVVIVLRPAQTELTLGHAAAMVAAFGGALASVIVRKVGREERSVVLLLYPLMANVLLMGMLLPGVYQPMPIEHLGALAAMSILAFSASLCLIAAYRAGEAAVIAPMQYSQMLWAIGFGWLLFGEGVDDATLIGSAVIILSGMYIVFRESAGKNSDNLPVLRTRSRHETGTMVRVGPLLDDKDKPDLPRDKNT